MLLRSTLLVLLSLAAPAQQTPPPAAPPGQPPVRVNVINVCTPSPEEQKDVAAALGRISATPRFAADFEVARGRTSTPGSPASNWVRVRREFPGDAVFATVQYSFVMDEQGMLETLVFRAREPTDLVQIALEDKVTAGTPAAVLASDTPASRVRVERLGKPSRGIARCPEADQSAYEPLFAQASQVLARYRRAMAIERLVKAELARLETTHAVPAPAASKAKGKGTKEK